jgi:hypothetical protein
VLWTSGDTSRDILIVVVFWVKLKFDEFTFNLTISPFFTVADFTNSP